MIRRREFITLLGGAAAWPLAARAQQGDRVRRIGVLMPDDENDPEQKLRYSAFTQALAGLGWTDGRDMHIELRWYGDDSNRARALAQELVGLQPDIIVTSTIPAIVALQQGCIKRKNPHKMRVSERGVLKSVTNRSGFEFNAAMLIGARCAQSTGCFRGANPGVGNCPNLCHSPSAGSRRALGKPHDTSITARYGVALRSHPLTLPSQW